MSSNFFSSSCQLFCGNQFKWIIDFNFCKFSLMPKLTLVNFSSLITIQLVMVRSWIHYWVGVSLMIIFPTFRWKKVSSKCYLTILNGINKLTCKTHISSTSIFGACFIIPMFDMRSKLEISSIWVNIVWHKHGKVCQLETLVFFWKVSIKHTLMCWIHEYYLN
jgi:hypothetical protein